MGSGGREHAIVWKLLQSKKVSRVFCCPGNAGIAEIAECHDIQPGNFRALAEFARANDVGLTVVGPEGPLVEGITDFFEKLGLKCFGPKKDAAILEGSKAFTREFLKRHNIPSAKFAVFENAKDAIAHVEKHGVPIVVKADGLAAGKGVVVCESKAQAIAAIKDMLEEKSFGRSGEKILLEEKLEGEEASILAFCDGKTVMPMVSSQDHKRVFDNDIGPNTGGMGAYAPAPVVSDAVLKKAVEKILVPAVKGMAAEGREYRGILYAGLMIKGGEPKVIEFNCRFGDPETQVVLPLMKSDLLDALLACVDGTLDKEKIEWKNEASACVIMASGGYPGRYETGKEISGLADAARHRNVMVFHAGTAFSGTGRIVSNGGRVLGVTAVAPELKESIRMAYGAVSVIDFENAHFRKDIGWRALPKGEKIAITYRDAGVDIDSGNKAKEEIKRLVRQTFDKNVLVDIGAFGGAYSAKDLKKFSHPVLVSSTDGVGTKLKVAALMGKWDTVGEDLVNHSVNDILCLNAKPLFFLDYIASSGFDAEAITGIVRGLSGACKKNGLALVGGETAAMPGTYVEGEFDLAGTIVGVVEKDSIFVPEKISAGDSLVGIASSGLHTNGYSLARKIFFEKMGLNVHSRPSGLNESVGSALLCVHKSYLVPVGQVSKKVKIMGIAHITGGGFYENIPRILPKGIGAEIRKGSWPVPALFEILRSEGGLPDEEFFRTFNAGIGLVLVVRAKDAEKAVKLLEQSGEKAFVIGKTVKGKGVKIT